MSPSCSENKFDIINDMYSLRTSIVMSKVSFSSCRSIYKDFIVGILQCARATSPVEMCFILPIVLYSNPGKKFVFLKYLIYSTFAFFCLIYIGNMLLKFRVNGEYIVKISRGILNHVY